MRKAILEQRVRMQRHKIRETENKRDRVKQPKNQSNESTAHP